MRVSIAVAGLLCGLQVAGTEAERQNAVAATPSKRSLAKRDGPDPDLTLLYHERTLSVPIDFFHNETRYEPHANGNFNLRYWFDSTYYKPGGPVFLLLGGEINGEARLPFLQKGIAHQVIKATGGLGVILEHRYYGKSFPVPDLTTKNMRFLTTEQSLAEIDYFARNVHFDGIDADLTSPTTPWIVYGGSYAGSQAAFLRVVYPDTFWGAISSSGVTVAIYDYWQYFEPARLFGPPDCIKNTQLLIDVVDGILIRQHDPAKVQALKNVFGMPNVTDNRDFANQLQGVSRLQATNWDPKVNSESFFNYCQNITANEAPGENLRSVVADLVSTAGYTNNILVQNIILNTISWLNSTALLWQRRSGKTQDSYFSSLNAAYLQSRTALENYGDTSWAYQSCTEWGQMETGDTPANIMPLISRTLDMEYSTFFCRAQFNITTPPEVERVNKYGGYNIEYKRLAFMGGSADPWRPATPMWYAESRKSSTDHPWHLINYAVHHWEENGVWENETTSTLPPPQIVYAQQFLKDFVVDWVEEFKRQKSRPEH